MARPPAPCGSYSAYKRHRRNKEPVDAACAAARDERTAATKAERAQNSGRPATIRLVPPPLSPPADEPESQIEQLRGALDEVKLAIDAVKVSAPEKLAPLIRMKVDLIRTIAALDSEGSATRAPTLAEQLATARAARTAGA